MHKQRWLAFAWGLREAVHWLQVVCAAPGIPKPYRYYGVQQVRQVLEKPCHI